MGTWTIGFFAGLTTWTLLEYVLHRWVFHRRVLGKTLAREHLMHHAKVSYFTSFAKKLAMAVPVLATIMALASLGLGLRLGSSIPLGVTVGWALYEIVHRRIHVAAPVGPYGHWLRRHHLLHHFGRSDGNHGVTTPIWDVVFGTLAPREVVKVPHQHVAKFPWLLDVNRAADESAPANSRDVAIAEAFVGQYRVI